MDEADVGKHYFELWVKICKMVKICQIFNNVLKLSQARTMFYQFQQVLIENQYKELYFQSLLTKIYIRIVNKNSTFNWS